MANEDVGSLTRREFLVRGAKKGTVATVVSGAALSKPVRSLVSYFFGPTRAYAQEPNAGNALPKTNSVAVDYDGLARQAKRVLTEKTYLQALDMLKPHEDDPNNKSSLFYVHLGMGYRYANDFARAEKNYKRALELNPLDESARINLGILYLRFINTPESRKLAEEQFKLVLNQINPNNSFAKMYLEGMSLGRF